MNAPTPLVWASAPLRRAGAFCLDVFFPPVCAGCRRVGAALCPACAAALVPVAGPICACCGRSLGDDAPPGLCPTCARERPPLAQMRAALRYVAPADGLIHRFKYEGCFSLGGALAEVMIVHWPIWPAAPDLVVPIPLHPRRRRHRGYNQSELLARPLAERLGLPYSAAALTRTRHTAPQVGLGPEARATNVQGAFTAAPEVVRGRSVLLIDDVLTTGATMGAAAAALLAAGAASVSAYCLARVS